MPAVHAELVAHLSSPGSYPGSPGQVEIVETHMSFVFLAGDRVYKMRKPIRLRFTDLTTLDARRRSSEREVELNQRLAPGIYLGTAPVTREPDGRLQLAGGGQPVEWLVVMKRLDRSRLLDARLRAGDVEPEAADQLCEILADFYSGAATVPTDGTLWVARWRAGIDQMEAELTAPEFGLPQAAVRRAIEAQRAFLGTGAELLATHAATGRIRDGHGDLRPEHVFLGPPVLLIDRPEFDDRVRHVDPFAEVALLDVECRRLGAPWLGPRLEACLAERLHDRPPPALLRFYFCNQACLRALLSIEHLRDPSPRTPARWPAQAMEYVGIACTALPLEPVQS